MLIVIIVIVLFLLSKTQNYILLLSPHQQETIKNYQNFLAKDLKDQLIGIDIKQKVRVKIWQLDIDTFLNQTLLEPK